MPDPPAPTATTLPAAQAAAEPRPGRLSRAARNPATAAIAAWLTLTPIAMVLPRWAHADPFAMRGAMLPVAVGGLLLIVVLALATVGGNGARRLRVAAEPLAGAAAGIFAAWVALTLRTALNGTPFGFGGLTGDMGRMSAMATRYSVTAASTDGIVAGVPSEYPPLYPWLIGRTAALTHVPAWRLLGEAEVLTTSAAVLVAFLLWRRLVAAPVALAIAGAGLAVFGDPRKAYEGIALFVFVPWVLSTFGRPPRGRLHWLSAGLIGGLLLLTYQGYFIWGSPGVLAFAALTWRGEADRRRYLLHVAKATAVAAAVAAWYLVPYAGAMAADGGQLVSDLFQAPAMTNSPFPFLATTPVGALELAGLAGLLWYRRTAWWAAPLLLLVTGTYVYQVIALVRFVASGHTGLYYHATRMIGLTLAVAGVLTLIRAAPRLARRLSTAPAPPRGLGLTALTVLLAWSGFTYWQEWRPMPDLRVPAAVAGGRPANYAADAHLEPLPGGRQPAYAPHLPPNLPPMRWFPVTPVRRAVAEVLGPDAAPRTLSYDERLFAYLPWPGYIAVDRTAAGSVTRWDDRHAALVRLAAVTDPATFAQASAHTEFGRIDLFVLRRSGVDWVWRDVRFHPGQFDPAVFTVVTDLPENTVLAVRESR